jgi:hypothetical protein
VVDAFSVLAQKVQVHTVALDDVDQLQLHTCPIVRFPIESPIAVAPSPRCAHGRPGFTRGCRAHAGADARIEDAEACGQLRLAFLPYGRTNKWAPEVR